MKFKLIKMLMLSRTFVRLATIYLNTLSGINAFYPSSTTWIVQLPRSNNYFNLQADALYKRYKLPFCLTFETILPSHRYEIGLLPIKAFTFVFLSQSKIVWWIATLIDGCGTTSYFDLHQQEIKLVEALQLYTEHNSSLISPALSLFHKI